MATSSTNEHAGNKSRNTSPGQDETKANDGSSSSLDWEENESSERCVPEQDDDPEDVGQLEITEIDSNEGYQLVINEDDSINESELVFDGKASKDSANSSNHANGVDQNGAASSSGANRSESLSLSSLITTIMKSSGFSSECAVETSETNEEGVDDPLEAQEGMIVVKIEPTENGQSHEEEMMPDLANTASDMSEVDDIQHQGSPMSTTNTDGTRSKRGKSRRRFKMTRNLDTSLVPGLPEVETISTPDGRVYKCRSCLVSFNHEQDMRMHLQTHLRPNYHCPICAKRFLNYSTLERHLITHDPNKPFSCNHCPQGFRVKSNLVRHVQRVHPEQDDAYKGGKRNTPRKKRAPKVPQNTGEQTPEDEHLSILRKMHELRDAEYSIKRPRMSAIHNGFQDNAPQDTFPIPDYTVITSNTAPRTIQSSWQAPNSPQNIDYFHGNIELGSEVLTPGSSYDPGRTPLQRFPPSSNPDRVETIVSANQEPVFPEEMPRHQRDCLPPRSHHPASGGTPSSEVNRLFKQEMLISEIRLRKKYGMPYDDIVDMLTEDTSIISEAQPPYPCPPASLPQELSEVGEVSDDYSPRAPINGSSYHDDLITWTHDGRETDGRQFSDAPEPNDEDFKGRRLSKRGTLPKHSLIFDRDPAFSHQNRSVERDDVLENGSVSHQSGTTLRDVLLQPRRRVAFDQNESVLSSRPLAQHDTPSTVPQTFSTRGKRTRFASFPSVNISHFPSTSPGALPYSMASISTHSLPLPANRATGLSNMQLTPPITPPSPLPRAHALQTGVRRNGVQRQPLVLDNPMDNRTTLNPLSRAVSRVARRGGSRGVRRGVGRGVRRGTRGKRATNGRCRNSYPLSRPSGEATTSGYFRSENNERSTNMPQAQAEENLQNGMLPPDISYSHFGRVPSSLADHPKDSDLGRNLPNVSAVASGNELAHQNHVPLDLSRKL